MLLKSLFIFTALSAAVASAQMTREQRIVDFQALAGLYAKQYGPYEWKKQQFGFDLFELRPWLERIDNIKTDAEFIDLCAEYTASLRDTHVSFAVPTTFVAQLGFGADVYDDKVLIETINRTLLPVARYPFVIGDEFVSIDGRPVAEVMKELERYTFALANPNAARRLSAARVVTRSQQINPGVLKLGDMARVEIRRANGDLETYDIAWTKTGVPVDVIGPLPNFNTKRASSDRAAWGSRMAPIPPDTPQWMVPLLELGHASWSGAPNEALIGWGSLNPVWAFPAGFQARVTGAGAPFLTGTFRAGTKTIGYIRFPNMAPSGLSLAQSYELLDREIAFLEQNTDGLIVDVMRNTGGFIIYGHEVARRLIPRPFRGVGFELRATGTRLFTIASQLQSLQAQNAPTWVIQMYTQIFNDILTAYKENRGRTGPLPLDMPSLDVQPAPGAYTKPLIVLIDEFSISTADLFPSLIQDSGRGLLVGRRTAGAGGTNGSYLAMPFLEAQAGVTFGLMVRSKEINTPDYGATRYIENVGVRPDIELDYMTRDNLMNAGRSFVQRITEIMLSEIERGPR